MDQQEQKVLAKYSSEGLRRNVLSPEGKRWQLWGKGVRGKEAEEVIEKIYER